ncbi:MAG: 6-carboxytetrahydropterin synthase [Planctomycetota bacterium]|nr:MAG: 6-carboxytetrahydropterin synthase [Planctomycetota bacterium]
MVELTRTIRFAVGGPAEAGPVHNGFAGWPAMAGLGAHYELDVACRGEPDPVTGYFLNITAIDAAGRRDAIPVIRSAFGVRGAEPTRTLATALRALEADLPGLSRVRWRLSPTYSLEMEPTDMTSALIRQSFEFAAAHRLHVPSLSDEENRRIFGACNNPAGHGHNYRVEPCVRVPVADGAPGFTLRDLERITGAVLIDHLDHTHLNADVPEFKDLNPSVENIARVCFDRLAPAIREAGAELARITVWETEKTSCVYPAG